MLGKGGAVVTGALGVLVAIAIGAAAISVLFGSGGPFSTLQGATTGSCTFSYGTGDVPSVTVGSSTADGITYAALPAGGLTVSAGETPGRIAIPSGVTITPAPVSGTTDIVYFQRGTTRFIVGFLAVTTTTIPATMSCDSSISASAAASGGVAFIATAGNAAKALTATALQDNNYNAIIIAIIALVPLGIFGAIGFALFNANKSRKRWA